MSLDDIRPDVLKKLMARCHSILEDFERDEKETKNDKCAETSCKKSEDSESAIKT